MWQIKSFFVEWKIKGTKKRFFMFLGALFLVIAVVGVFVPVIPQVPFAVISAYFFSKGSATIHLWIRHNKFFGTPVREWEDFKVIRPKMKIIATASMLAGAVFGHYKLDHQWAITLDVFLALGIIFVLTRKNKIISI
jgi:uncharacterized membrane protein YbaN (DUF454 family)